MRLDVSAFTPWRIQSAMNWWRTRRPGHIAARSFRAIQMFIRWKKVIGNYSGNSMLPRENPSRPRLINRRLARIRSSRRREEAEFPAKFQIRLLTSAATENFCHLFTLFCHVCGDMIFRTQMVNSESNDAALRPRAFQVIATRSRRLLAVINRSFARWLTARPAASLKAKISRRKRLSSLGAK